MAVVWEPDNRLRPSPHSPNAWDVDTGPLRAALAGWRTGRPTVAVWGPHGARVTQQLDRLVWIMADGSRVPIASAGPAQESTSAPNVLRVSQAVGGVEDVWEVQGNRLKHTWQVPHLVVPEGAVSLAMEGTLILQGVTLAAPEGRSAGAIGLYHQSQAAPVMEIARGEAVDDVEGARTHVAYEWYPSLREAANGAVVKDSRKIYLSTLVAADWIRSLQGGFSIDPTISTSTSSAATAYPNQQKVDRFSNGVLFGLFYDSSNLVCRYSSDNGATWQTPTAGATIGAFDTSSVFITPDDRIHMSVSNPANVRYYYGVPDANRTGYTWASIAIDTTGYGKFPDVVAHAEGTGWKAHVVWSNTSASAAKYQRLSIASNGAISLDGSTVNIVTGITAGPSYPSVTIDTTKRLHVVLTTGVAGVGKGVRYRSAPYSSGSWTWGTEEAVTESYYANRMGPCVADSQGRVLVAFSDHVSGYLRVFRRGTAGDWTDMLTGQNTVNNPTLTVDSNDNPYVFYMRSGGLSGINYIWHTGSSWTSETNVEGGVCDYPSARRDTSGSAVDVLYTTGSSSPYTVKSYRLNLNQPPSKPTNLVRDNFDAVNVASFSWTHVDPDGNAQASRQVQIIRADTGATVYDSGKVATATQSMTLAGATLTNGLQYQWRVMTWDTSDAASPWSDYATFYCSATGTPAITNPAADGATVTTSSITAQGTFSSPGGSGISAWQWWLTTPADAVLWTSGKQTSSSQPLYTVGYTLANTTSYKLKLQVWDGYGVASGVVERSFSVSFTPPPEPLIKATPYNANGYIWVKLATQTGDVASNDLYRRPVGGSWIRIATGIAPNGTYADYAAASGVTYEYQVDAIGTNGVSTASPVVNAALALTRLWVHDTADPITAFPVGKSVDRGNDWAADGAMLRFAGRKLPVAAMNGTTDDTYRVQLLIEDRQELDLLQALVARLSPLCVRDNSGRVVFGMVLSLPIHDELWGGWTVALDVQAVDYSEEV